MNNEPYGWVKNGEYVLYIEKPDSVFNYIPLYTHPAELTDEEINKLWAESHEDGIAMQQGFTTQQHYFAHLILRKASEK